MSKFKARITSLHSRQNPQEVILSLESTGPFDPDVYQELEDNFHDHAPVTVHTPEKIDTDRLTARDLMPERSYIVGLGDVQCQTSPVGMTGSASFGIIITDPKVMEQIELARRQARPFRIVIPSVRRTLTEDEAFEGWFKREGYKGENRDLARQVWEGAVKWGKSGGNPERFCNFQPKRVLYQHEKPSRCLLYKGHDNGVHDK